MRIKWSLLFFAAGSVASFGQVSVLTANYDNNRTNANTAETLLNLSNVNSRQFGKLYSFAVDGQVYAQPLYVAAADMPVVGTRNVLIVATMHNSVYAFDADAGAGTAPLWHVNFGPAVNPLTLDPSFDDILTEVGILSTPVIDPATNTIYVVHETAQGNQYAFYLHALDLFTGSEKFSGPAPIQASVPGTGWGGLHDATNGILPFIAVNHLQRPGLLLANGTVYVAFGSHGDLPPWHGWLVGYSASTLQQTLVFSTTPSNAGGGAIWQGGRGIAADSLGNLYFSTGNGTYDGATSWGESVVRLSPGGSVLDWFTPSEWSNLNDQDADFGSNGPILVPGTNLMIAGGKEGIVGLLDRTNMGHEVASNGQIVQSFQASDSGGLAVFNAALWPVAGGPYFFMFAFNEPLRAYRMVNGQFATSASSVNTTVTNGLPYSGFTVSSNASVPGSGVLWLTTASSGTLPAAGTLHAFNALNVAQELWNSDMSGMRDTLGGFSKFANPTTANGKVFVPTATNQVVAYGLLPDVPGVASIVNAASFQSSTVAPGELITIFGNNVGPGAGVAATIDKNLGQFPFQLAGVQIAFDGKPAPLLYAGPGQVNTVVPFGISGNSTVMSLTTPGGGSFSVTLPVTAAAPAFFTRYGNGSGSGAILNNADFSQNSPSNPSLRGSYVAIFITGAGATNPAGTDGQIAQANSLPLVAQTVKVTIGGLDAPVVYQGGAPGLIAGVTQLNVQVPDAVEPGTWVPVTLTVGGIPSQNTVIMAVQ